MSIKVNFSFGSGLHPGQVLQQLLEDASLSQSELARRINVNQGKISEIISGKRGIATDMACRLAKAFGMSPVTWLDMQAKYELSKINLTQFDNIKKIDFKKAA